MWSADNAPLEIVKLSIVSVFREGIIIIILAFCES